MDAVVLVRRKQLDMPRLIVLRCLIDWRRAGIFLLD